MPFAGQPLDDGSGQPMPSHNQDIAVTAAINIPSSDTNSHIVSPHQSIAHSSCRAPLIKHIPRSARPHIATELTSILNHIISDPDNLTN